MQNCKRGTLRPRAQDKNLHLFNCSIDIVSTKPKHIFIREVAYYQFWFTSSPYFYKRRRWHQSQMGSFGDFSLGTLQMRLRQLGDPSFPSGKPWSQLRCNFSRPLFFRWTFLINEDNETGVTLSRPWTGWNSSISHVWKLNKTIHHHVAYQSLHMNPFLDFLK